MEINFTLEQLVDEVRKLASEKPDFVYEAPDFCAPTCSYTKSKTSETEGCIFGQSILRLQPELRTKIDSMNIISTLLQDLGVIGNRYDSQKKMVEWCVIVQGLQDNKCVWKDSVAGADEKIEILFGK